MRARSIRRIARTVAALALAGLAACGATASVGSDAGSQDGSTLDGGDSAAAVPDARADGIADPPRTRVYATIVSHNEEVPHVRCTPVVTDRETYLVNRARTLALARAVVEGSAAWDLQSDWQWLDAVRTWDTGDVVSDTAGKNVARYLSELAPERIVLDAHAHETRYDYADVVRLHEDLGVPRNGVVGGFLYFPFADEAWTRLEQPLAGRVFPDATWTAELLWGAATKNHLGPDSKASGVWRPRDAEHFHEHSPTRRLVNVGGYTGAAGGVADLLAKLRAGQLAPNKMYTATIFVNQCDVSDATVAELRAVFARHAPDVAAGDLVWATLPRMLRAWHDTYGEAPTIFEPSVPSDAGPDGATLSCADGGTCAPRQVCCAAPLACAGRCVPDCRASGGTCPTQAPRCDPATGVCLP